MRRLKKFMTPGFILLFFGSLALGNGFISWYFVPRKKTLAALEREVREKKLLVQQLQQLPIPDVDEAKDVLPESLSVGYALSVIERAAKEAGIRSISFETNRESGEEAGPKVPVVQEQLPPGESPGAGKGKGGRVPDPKAMACTLKVHGRFQALLRFLGKLESSTLLMQVVTLDARPRETGVQAEIGLRIYYYPEPQKEATGG